jgi:hypothetical protein
LASACVFFPLSPAASSSLSSRARFGLVKRAAGTAAGFDPEEAVNRFPIALEDA